MLNMTLRSQAGDNRLNVLCNLTLSSVKIMPIKGKTMVTCFAEFYYDNWRKV